jgi:predicted peptidase
MPEKQKNYKKLIIILCIVLSVLITITAGATAFVIYQKSKQPQEKPQNNISAPVASGDSVFVGSPDASDNASTDTSTQSEHIQSDWSSYEDEEESTPTSADLEPRIEKVFKTYELKDEFEVPKYQKLYFNDTKTDKVLPYSLSLPKNYSKNKKYPVLLLLHGLGAQGADHVSASGSFSSLFKYNGDLLSQAIVVIPQTTGWWYAHEMGQDDGWLGAAMRMLYQLEETYSCDKNRVYVMGLSMGGYGTWNALSSYSEHFAAGVPICGGGDPAYAEILADMPIWIYHGELDDTVGIYQSEVMYNAIKEAGGNKIHFTRLPAVKHDSWLNAFRSRELLSWLFSQSKAKQSDSYSLVPYFKIVDSKGKTVITEFDSTELSLVNINGVDQLEFTLSDNGVKKLSNAYKNSGGKPFDVYYGTQKLLSFTATKKPTDNLFVIRDIFTTSNYYWYVTRITDVMNY